MSKKTQYHSRWGPNRTHGMRRHLEISTHNQRMSSINNGNFIGVLNGSKGTSAVDDLPPQDYKMMMSFICSCRNKKELADHITADGKRKLDDIAAKKERRKAYEDRNKCQHGRLKGRCSACGGGQICEHKRRKSQCRDCYGSAFCRHGKRKERCRDCDGNAFCRHGKTKNYVAPAAGLPPAKIAGIGLIIKWD